MGVDNGVSFRYAHSMSEFNVDMDQNSIDFEQGMNDGYTGYRPDMPDSESYMAGYAAGSDRYAQDAEQDLAYAEMEYGYEDYEPSPYFGDYSEM